MEKQETERHYDRHKEGEQGVIPPSRLTRPIRRVSVTAQHDSSLLSLRARDTTATTVTQQHQQEDPRIGSDKVFNVEGKESRQDTIKSTARC